MTAPVTRLLRPSNTSPRAIHPLAALAGIPGSVVKAARRQLREFEQRASINPVQPDLFVPTWSSRPELVEDDVIPAMQRLAAINPDELTPKQALEALYDLKALIR